MPFDLDRGNVSTRFYWGETQEEWVDLRIISEKDFRRLSRESGIKDRVEYVPNPNTGQMCRVEYRERDDDKIADLDARVNDLCITDWHLVTPDGSDIPCTSENKAKLLDGYPEFSAWIARCMKQMRGDMAKAGESETKN